MKHILLGELVLILLLPFTSWWNFHWSPHNQLMGWLPWNPSSTILSDRPSLGSSFLKVPHLHSSQRISYCLTFVYWCSDPFPVADLPVGAAPCIREALGMSYGLCVLGPSMVSGTQLINELKSVNGFFNVRNVNFHWSSGIGNSVCIWKLCSANFKLTFQRNWLTRQMRLLRKGKEKDIPSDRGYLIHGTPS